MLIYVCLLAIFLFGFMWLRHSVVQQTRKQAIRRRKWRNRLFDTLNPTAEDDEENRR